MKFSKLEFTRVSELSQATGDAGRKQITFTANVTSEVIDVGAQPGRFIEFRGTALEDPVDMRQEANHLARLIALQAQVDPNSVNARLILDVQGSRWLVIIDMPAAVKEAHVDTAVQLMLTGILPNPVATADQQSAKVEPANQAAMRAATASNKTILGKRGGKPVRLPYTLHAGEVIKGNVVGTYRKKPNAKNPYGVKQVLDAHIDGFRRKKNVVHLKVDQPGTLKTKNRDVYWPNEAVEDQVAQLALHKKKKVRVTVEWRTDSKARDVLVIVSIEAI